MKKRIRTLAVLVKDWKESWDAAELISASRSHTKAVEVPDTGGDDNALVFGDDELTEELAQRLWDAGLVWVWGDAQFVSYDELEGRLELISAFVEQEDAEAGDYADPATQGYDDGIAEQLEAQGIGLA